MKFGTNGADGTKNTNQKDFFEKFIWKWVKHVRPLKYAWALPLNTHVNYIYFMKTKRGYKFAWNEFYPPSVT